jgi:hypothetical protein
MQRAHGVIFSQSASRILKRISGNPSSLRIAIFDLKARLLVDF